MDTSLPSEHAKQAASSRTASRYELPGKAAGSQIGFGLDRTFGRFFQFWPTLEEPTVDEDRLSQGEIVALLKKYGKPSRQLEMAISAFMMDLDPKEYGLRNIQASDEREARFHEGPGGTKEFEAWKQEQGPDFEEKWDTMNEEYGDMLKKADLDEIGLYDLFEEESMFAEGENVSLEDLPQELQENVENPPPSVQKLKRKMEESMGMEVGSCSGPGVSDGIGPMWDAPECPYSEDESEETMFSKIGPGEEALLPVEVVRMRAARQRLTWNREAAGGLYGYTRQTQNDVEASIRKVQKKVSALARDIYAKDERVASFLVTHTKRGKSATAKLLVTAMKGIGPKLASDKTARMRYSIQTGFGLNEKVMLYLHENGIQTERGHDWVRADLNPAQLKALTRWLLKSDPHHNVHIYDHRDPNGPVWDPKNGVDKLASDKTATDQMEVADLLGMTLQRGQAYSYAEILELAKREAGIGNRVSPYVEPAIQILMDEGQLVSRGSEYLKIASNKIAKGLYGHPAKTARLGLSACSELRAFVGEIAADLHERRTANYEKITGFLGEHSKQAHCEYSRMLLGCYPGLPGKQASVTDMAELIKEDDLERNSDESYMDTFNQAEFSEIQEKMKSGELSDGEADDITKTAFVPESVAGWLLWEDGTKQAALKSGVYTYDPKTGKTIKFVGPMEDEDAPKRAYRGLKRGLKVIGVYPRTGEFNELEPSGMVKKNGLEGRL